VLVAILWALRILEMSFLVRDKFQSMPFEIFRGDHTQNLVLYILRSILTYSMRRVLLEKLTGFSASQEIPWYGHVQKMAERRLPRMALKWMPKQKTAQRRPKKNWMEGIRKVMDEGDPNEGQWEDRKQWSLGVGQRRTF